MQSVAVGNGQGTGAERVETRDERVQTREAGQSFQSLVSQHVDFVNEVHLRRNLQNSFLGND